MTAVEQFIEQLEKQGDSWENVSMGTINISINVDVIYEIGTKAKEMEKEQIIEAHSDGRKRQVDNSEQYYNETFKSE